jgi:catechol 2,3-dioxygenase-like lactoylglutathione lyase family enzyme
VADPASDESRLRPDNPDHLRKLAKQLLRLARNGDQVALARFISVIGNVQLTSLTLSQAQYVIAREAGFTSWPRMRDEADWRQNVRTKHQIGSVQHLSRRDTQMLSSLPEITAIDQIGLSCTDLDEAERFYCGVLGLQLTGTVPDVMKFFGCNGVNIVMFRSETIPPNSIVYFRIPSESGSIDRSVSLLKSQDVRFETDPHVIARKWNGCDIWIAFFRDPFGNLLALKSDVPTK